MELRDILLAAGLTLSDVAVLLHVSDKPRLHKALPYLAAEKPELFDAIQNQHGPGVEATLKTRRFMASFVNVRSDEYVFAGIFAVTGSRFHTMAELDADPNHQFLQQLYGHTVFVELGRTTGLRGRLVFDLVRQEILSALIGRLVVRKPIGTRSYRFLAENLAAPVVEISREPRLTPPPPPWQDFVVTATELKDLPHDWRAELARWRGVYLIVDEENGARYVGSAYGGENLLGRWQAHIAREKGVTVELGQRDPSRFRFSILQLLLHDATPDEVFAVESNWKKRLHTREWGLNRN